MSISEQVELLGAGLYKGKNIPDKLTIEAIPTISELEYVSSEDFDNTMLDKILPQAVKEKINFRELLEIDYHWLLRCLRLLNYGPYHTTNSIFCSNCGRTFGEYKVNLTAVECKPLPAGFKNDITISRDEFLDFNGDVKIRMLTIAEALQAAKDTAFQTADGTTNRRLARMCYMIRSIGTEVNLTPVDVRIKLEKEFTSPDYLILKEVVRTLTDYGIRAGGSTVCPKCGNKEATFVALIDDRYFRPTLDDLRAWKADKSKRRNEDSARSSAKNV